MPSNEEHCRECLEKLGEPFEHVHKWLDELCVDRDQEHRLARHHLEGVMQVRQKWGDRAAKAAELHIVADVGMVLSAADLRRQWRRKHPHRRDFSRFAPPPVM